MGLIGDGLALAAPEIGVPLKIWNAVKPFLPYIAGVLAILLIVREIERYGYHERDAEVAGLHKQIKDRDDASIAVALKNKAQVHQQEAGQTDHTQDANHDDTIRKVAADDAVASYIRLHHATGGSASGADALRPRANPAGSPPEADPNAGIHDPVIVPASDLVICKDAVLKGQSFDAWWPGAAKIINDAADQAAKAAAQGS